MISERIKSALREAESPVDDPMVFLSLESQTVTLKTAKVFCQRNETRGRSLRVLLVAISKHAEHESIIYSEFSSLDNDMMAISFAKDSLLALESCLKAEKILDYHASASAIRNVGQFLCLNPLEYRFDIIKQLSLLPGSQFLSWLHYAQLSRLADVVPFAPKEPKLIPWEERDQRVNAKRLHEYRKEYAACHKTAVLIYTDILRLASDVIHNKCDPNELLQVVNQRLGKRGRGRPQRRRIDYDSPVVVSAIPTVS